MKAKFKFELGQKVCHRLSPFAPMIIIERLYYDRQGGASVQYFCRAKFDQDKLYSSYETELDLYIEGAREKMWDEIENRKEK